MIYGYNGYNYINDSGFKLNNSDDMIYYTIFSTVESLESNIFPRPIYSIRSVSS